MRGLCIHTARTSRPDIPFALFALFALLALLGLAGLGIGFHDGLIGPGTGTFLVPARTATLHLDLVTASATAKIVNCCTNAGALATFARQGGVLWRLAALTAVFNLAGAPSAPPRP